MDFTHPQMTRFTTFVLRDRYRRPWDGDGLVSTLCVRRVFRSYSSPELVSSEGQVVYSNGRAQKIGTKRVNQLCRLGHVKCEMTR
jgi:hypothetical protein